MLCTIKKNFIKILLIALTLIVTANAVVTIIKKENQVESTK